MGWEQGAEVGDRGPGWDGEQGCFKETPPAVGELDYVQACWLPVKTQACPLRIEIKTDSLKPQFCGLV